MRLFGSALKREQQEAGRRYLRLLFALCARQEDAADEFNEASAACGFIGRRDAETASALLPAIDDLVAVAQSIQRDHRSALGIDNAWPELTAVCAAWELTWSRYLDWARATRGAVRAVSSGLNPDFDNLDRLAEELKRCQAQAERSQVALYKTLKMSAQEILSMLGSATTAPADPTGLSLEEWHAQTTIPFINGVWDALRSQLAPNGLDRHLATWRYGSLAVAIQVSALIEATADSNTGPAGPLWKSLHPEHVRNAMNAALAVFFSWVVWSKPDPERDDEKVGVEASMVFAEDPWSVGLMNIERAHYQFAEQSGGFVLPGEDLWFITSALFGKRSPLDDLLSAITDGDWPPSVVRADLLGVELKDLSDPTLITNAITWRQSVVDHFEAAMEAMHKNGLTVNQFLDPILGL